MDLEELCLKIAKSEDGDIVKRILEDCSIWNDDSCWGAVVSKEQNDAELNNFSIIGSQQSNAANALVEKLINCGDSALILQCHKKGIDIKGDDAPTSVKTAIAELFGVLEGRWIAITFLSTWIIYL